MIKLNERKIKTTTFVHILKDIHLNCQNIPKFLDDKRLTLAEKKILRCWTFLRRGEHKLIHETLGNIDTSYDELVDSQKNALIGMAYNNAGDPYKGAEYLRKTLEVLPRYQDIGNVYFIALYSYFYCSFNTKNTNEMAIVLELIKKFPHKNSRQETYYLHCLFNFHAFNNHRDQANAILKKLHHQTNLMSEPVFMGYSVGRYLFYIKEEDFKSCYAVLDEIKKRRSFYSKSNYLFMRTLLDNYVHNDPIYAYEKDFADDKILFHQMMTIKSLEESNRELADMYWRKLSQYNPKLFASDFTYNGPKDIFQLCLSKHLKPTTTEEIPIDHLPKKKEDALVFILEKANHQIPMEELYQTIWQKNVVDKADIMKLKKMVSRLRQSRNLDIQYRKGCYRLVK